MPTYSTRGIRYRPDTRWGGNSQIRTTPRHSLAA